MRPLARIAATRLAAPLICGLFGFGLGFLTWNFTSTAQAQADPAAKAADTSGEKVDISLGDAEKIKQADEAIAVAQTALVQDGRYVPAIRSPNAYAVLHGGVDAIAELESGRGVDPVTFAGLYKGDALDSVLPHLGRDTLGRLTYKGKLVRMYPVERMRELEATKTAILDLAAGGAGIIGEQQF